MNTAGVFMRDWSEGFEWYYTILVEAAKKATKTSEINGGIIFQFDDNSLLIYSDGKFIHPTRN